jgi:predicted alpha/beta superfamily hydrolase
MAVIFRLVIVMLGLVGAAGNIVFEGTIQSAILQTNRFIRVYLPPGYNDSRTTRFPVLYVHDGQNAFTSAGSHAAFGWGNWQLDKTADRLIAGNKIRPLIIVAIDCSPSRYREYRGPIAPGLDNRAYERYARFLVEELKPRIDRDYRTLASPEHTGLLGSSMGGICSVALAWENPNTFGLAASLSGAFQVEKQYFLKNTLTARSAKKKPLRIYLDSGIADYSGGDDGLKHTEAVALQLQHLGWKPGHDLLHHIDRPLTADQLKPFDLPEDKFNEAQRSQHNELYWRLRAWRALTFLFPPQPS